MLEKLNPYKALHGNSTSARCSPAFATQRTMMLLGCYRQGEAADPKTYVAAVAAVLAHYDEDVVRYVTDPITGLPGAVKWLPTVAEVRQACEDRLKPMYEAMAREKREADTRLLLTPPTASADERERAWERWKQDIRPEVSGKASEAEMRAAALKRLDELDHEYRQVRRERGLPPLTDDMRRILEPSAQEDGSA